MALVSSGPAAAQRRGPGPRARIANLTPEQRERLKNHVREAQSEMRGIRMDLRDVRLNLYGQFREYRLDERRVQNSVRRINDLQRSLLDSNLENQLRLRDILTRGQFESLQEAVHDRDVERDGPHVWPGDDGPVGNVDRLRLSSEQKERIKRLWRSSRETAADLGTKLRSSSQDLQRLYMDYDLDQKQANKIIDRIGDTQLDLLKATVSRQVELRRILTEQQFRALSKSIRPPGGRGGHRGQRGAGADMDQDAADLSMVQASI